MDVIEQLETHRLNVILKARQLGMTWLVLCYVLWNMLYRPVFTALLFSRRETEALYLLGQQRLRGIYSRLPSWMKTRQVVADSSHEWVLSNGSVAYGFPTTAGDSYTAGFAFVDEADLVPDLNRLMNAVKPTIDGGGSMVLLSRADKTNPGSEFKRIYRGARAGANGWNPIFLPWYARPDRTQEWYETQKRDILSRTGSLDDLYQQYPSTDEEALMPPMLDRRLPYQWIQECSAVTPWLPQTSIPLPGLRVYEEPVLTQDYVIGVDPAEGNPHSDDSVAQVVNRTTLEQVAVLSGKIEPEVFSDYIVTLSDRYNGAKVMVERNNHGHVVIARLNETERTRSRLLNGLDGSPGWMSSVRGKAMMYDILADQLRAGTVTIRDETTRVQLTSIEGSSLRAPENEADDYAVAFALAITGAVLKPATSFVFPYTNRARDRKVYGRRSRLSLS